VPAFLAVRLDGLIPFDPAGPDRRHGRANADPDRRSHDGDRGADEKDGVEHGVSDQGSAGTVMPGGALAGARVVEAPHLFLKEQILVQRMNGRHGPKRGFRAVIALGIDWFHGRPPQ